MAETTVSAMTMNEVGARFGGLGFGSGRPVVIAGPCSVESEEQILSAARAVKAAGATALRGGMKREKQASRSPGRSVLARQRGWTRMIPWRPC